MKRKIRSDVFLSSHAAGSGVFLISGNIVIIPVVPAIGEGIRSCPQLCCWWIKPVSVGSDIIGNEFNKIATKNWFSKKKITTVISPLILNFK